MNENEQSMMNKQPGPIGERLMQLIHYYHMNMNSFSNRINLKSNSIITRIVKDPGRGMSLELLQKILIEFPGINPDWFVCGRGEMLRGESEKVLPKTEPCRECAWKDEKISLLESIIKSKDEVIEVNKARIASYEGDIGLGKRAASV